MDTQREMFQSMVEQAALPSLSKDNHKTDKSVEGEKGKKLQRGGKQFMLCPEKPLEEISEKNDSGDISDCVSSEVSDNSDWSDEEKEKLEKLFGAMSERGEECEKIRHLRRSRTKSTRMLDSLSLGTMHTSSGEVATLVYSRDSSLSCLTASSLNCSTHELDSQPLDTASSGQNIAKEMDQMDKGCDL